MTGIESKNIRIAILDLYEGQANQGMRCIRDILAQWGEVNQITITIDEFEVRLAMAVPDNSYDIYISTGGPGSPLDTINTEWENKYFGWLKSMEEWNNRTDGFPKKQVFFICHSFQLACRHYEVGTVCKRKSTAFGVFPIHQTEDGNLDTVFNDLKDTFYSVDRRD